MEFSFVNGTVVLRPLRSEENPFAKWLGVLAKNTPEGTAVAWVREMRGKMDEE